MSIINGNIKVSESKASKGLEALKFNINYETRNSISEQKKNSHSIISAIKGNKRLLIEVDSSLINLPEKDREEYIIEFVKFVRNTGLEYRYRKVPNAGGQSFISKLFTMGSKANDAHQILILVTDEAWSSDEFIAALPYYGVRYYILNEEVDTTRILDDMYNGQILGFEVYDYFSTIVFDCCSFGQMGIYTESLTLRELKTMLGL